MILFLDPRLIGEADYSFRTKEAMRRCGVCYPYLAFSGPTEARVWHFLGTREGAYGAIKAPSLDGATVSKLICVTEKEAAGVSLSEPDARFLTVAQADALATKNPLPTDGWSQAILDHVGLGE